MNGTNRSKIQRAAIRGLELLAVIAVTALIGWFYFGLDNADFTLPFSISRDGLSSVVGTIDTAYGNRNLFGWPYHIDTSPYAAQTSLMQRAGLMLAGLFIKNAFVLNNLKWYAAVLLNVIACYCVLRHFRVRRWLAYLCALCYGFCAYVQYRWILHTSLSTIECIPLVFLLCIWCLEDERFNRLGKGWVKYPRNWYGLLFCWMIANNGMVYYPYFSCFIFCVTALCLLLWKRDRRALAAPLTLVAEVVGWLGCGFIPTVVGAFRLNFNTFTQSAERGPAGVGIYSLRLGRLLVSPKGWGLPFLHDFVVDYDNAVGQAYGWNESDNAYLGVIGVIGFFILLFYLVARAGKKKPESVLGHRLMLLACIEVAILLLAVQGGLGTIIGVLFPHMRGYNRLSPFLLFGCVMAVALCVQEGLRRYADGKDKRRAVALYGLTGAVLLFSLWEQQGISSYFLPEETESVRAFCTANESFVQQIEQISGADAMVFQLPYMRSFENGNTGDIPDYDHKRGALFSNTLRWSYGQSAGMPNDLWYKATSMLPPSEMVAELARQGFGGIWLNLDGYVENGWEGQRLMEALMEAAHCRQALQCGDTQTFYIPITNVVYDVGPRQEVRGIWYTATEENIALIRAELTGNSEAAGYLDSCLAENGADGAYHCIEVPADGPDGVALRAPAPKASLAEGEVCAEKTDLILQQNGTLSLAEFPLTVQENTYYRIDLTLAEDTAPGVFPRLQAGIFASGKDNVERKVSGFALEGRCTYHLYINTGGFSGSSRKGYVRIFGEDLGSEVRIKELRVTQMHQIVLEYETDPLTDEVRRIVYTNTAENARKILEDLTGSDEAMARLAERLHSSTELDGDILLPEEDGYHIHVKTPEERGELVAVQEVVNQTDFALYRDGSTQTTLFPFAIKSDTIYKVEVEFADTVDLDTAADLAVDFYSGPEYDSHDQEADDFILDGRFRYTFYFDSGTVPENIPQCNVRIFTFNLFDPIEVDSLRVTEMAKTA